MNVQSPASTAASASPTDLSGNAQIFISQMATTAGKVQTAQTETHGIDELLMKLALSGADAKTLILARQILECDQMISDNLEEIGQLNKLRQAHSQRKQELVAFKAFVNKYGGDGGKIGDKELRAHWAEFVADNEALAAKYGLTPMPADWDPSRPEAPTPPELRSEFNNSTTASMNAMAWANYQNERERWENAVNTDPNFSREVSSEAYMDKLGERFLGKQSFATEDAGLETNYGGSIFNGESISVEEVEAAMLRQDDAIQKLDQAKELINIRNQQALQRKQRTLTLVSNFNQAEHEGRKAVISNTRA